MESYDPLTFQQICHLRLKVKRVGYKPELLIPIINLEIQNGELYAAISDCEEVLSKEPKDSVARDEAVYLKSLVEDEMAALKKAAETGL